MNPPSHPLPNTIVPIYAYLVSGAKAVLLFDTGLGPPHEYIDATYRPGRRSLPALLSQQGIAPDDVEFVVNCHLHFDHCGGNRLFPRARIVVQRAELEAARKPMYTVPEWVDFDGVQFEVVEGEHTIWENVYVLPTPGHTRGHQSLVLETPDGRVVLAGQIAESASGFEGGTGGCEVSLEGLGAASIAKIKELSPHRVLFAHDDAEWGPGASQFG